MRFEIPFLKAEWCDVALLSYSVDPSRVDAVLPRGLVPDCYEGRAFVSLVGLHFRRTRVLGVPWPGHTAFPEVNLRVYVRHPETDTRGVWFEHELVPKRLVTWIARRTYDEPYRTVPIRSSRSVASDAVTVTYRAAIGGGEQTIRVSGMRPAEIADSGTLTHFLKERYYGFGRGDDETLRRYTVEHPPWQTHPVDAWHLDLDWAQTFGDAWAFLQGTEPASVLLCAGSPIAVSWHESVTNRIPPPAPRTPAIPPFRRRPSV